MREVSTARIPTSTSSPDGVAPGPRPTTLASTSPRAAATSTADLTACAIRADSCQDPIATPTVARTASRRIQARFDLVVARRQPPRGRTAVNDTEALPEPKPTKPALTLTGSPLRKPERRSSTTRPEFRTEGPPCLRPTASTSLRESSDSQRERTRCERRRSQPSPRRERGQLKGLGFVPFGSRDSLDEVLGIGNPTENAALCLDHF